MYVHCQGGYRSMIAASILKRKGFDIVKNIKGGYLEIVKQGIPVEVSQPALN
ncbi:MAG: rhodanese-like domain-containing protein [Bacteroidota bacterium]